MEEEDGVGILIDLGEPNPRPRQQRRSFYALPKTLSEEDDTFGVLSRTGSVGASVDNTVDTGVLIQIDNSQSSTETSPTKAWRPESSGAERAFRAQHLSSTTSLSVSSFSNSRYFDNISRISDAETPAGASCSVDEVFESVLESSRAPPPDWELLMNEAQSLARSIHSEKPAKTPANSVASVGMFGNFSPCDVMDINKENPPEDLLVPLSPDKSPVRDLNQDLLQNYSLLLDSPAAHPDTLEVDGIKLLDPVSQPSASINTEETPKKSMRRRVQGTGQMQKENLNPAVQPRQLVSKPSLEPCNPSLEPCNPSLEPCNPSLEHCNPSLEPCNPSREPCNTSWEPCNPSREVTKPASLEGSVEKQIKSKIQKSNVMRTSMTNPALNLENKVEVASNIRTTPFKPLAPLQNTISVDQRKGPSSSTKSTASRLSLAPSNQQSSQTLKSRIDTGMSAVKGTLTKGSTPAIKGSTPAIKNSFQSRTSSKVNSGVKSQAASSSKSAGLNSSLMQAPRPNTAFSRQGNGLVRPSSTGGRYSTPLRGARQSLSFYTPSSSQPSQSSSQHSQSSSQHSQSSSHNSQSSSQHSQSSSHNSKSSSQQSQSRSQHSSASFQYPTSASHSIRKPPTSASHNKASSSQPVLSANHSSIDSSHLATPITRLPAPSRLATPRTSLALPSPQVYKGNSSLICSTPAAQSSRLNNTGLPSPIHVMRRTSKQ